MWIRRKHYEHLFRQLSEARESILKLERMEAGHMSTIEWLRTHVNRLEAERGILTADRLHVLLPVPSIEREPYPLRPNDGPTNARPRRDDDPPQGEVVHGLPVDPVTKGLPEDAIAIAQLLGANLDDIGDDAAGRMGIEYDAAGHVVYTR